MPGTDKLSKAALIRDFFGLLPGETASKGGPDDKGFMGEYRSLSEEDRMELAQRIARQRGLDQSAVDFPLA